MKKPRPRKRPQRRAAAPSGAEEPPAKLQKVLAELGHGSRREVEKWIEAGRVHVNGEPAHLGQRVGAEDSISIDGKEVTRRARSFGRVLIYNKPAGVVCTRRDPEGRPTVFD